MDSGLLLNYMSLQKEDVLIIAKKVDLRIKQMIAGMNRATPRMDKLLEKGYGIEAMILNSQIVEQVLKVILKNHQEKRDLLIQLGEIDHFKDESIPADVSKCMLGDLIKYLKTYIGPSQLITDLFNYSKDFRNDFVHHVFFISDEKLEESNKEAIKYLNQSEEFQRLTSGLRAEANKVKNEIGEILLQNSQPEQGTYSI